MRDQTYPSVPTPILPQQYGNTITEPDQVEDVPQSAVEVKKKDALVEQGGTGTIIVNGFLSGQDYNPEFTGTQRIKTFDEMRLSDATVRAALLAVKLPLLSTDWYIKDPTSKDKLGEPAQFVADQLFKNKNFSFTSFLRQVLTMCENGNSIFEKVFEELPDGKIGWKRISQRLSKTIYRWTLNDGRSPGVYQILPTGKTAEIPRWKLLYFINEQEGSNYEGQSLLRAAHKHWYFKNLYYKIDAIATEKQGMGVPKITAPPQATPQDKAKMREIAQNMRTNEKGYVEAPQGWSIEFMDMKGNTIKDSKEMIAHHDRQIVKAMLAQFLELGANGGGGSYALSADQSKLFLLGLEYLAKIFQEEMNKAIRELVELNFAGLADSDYPTLEYGAIGQIDFEKLSQALERMANSQILTPDLELEKYMRASMNLPIPDELGELREEREAAKTLLPDADTPTSKKPANQEDDDELDDEEAELADDPPKKPRKPTKATEFMQDILEFHEQLERVIGEKRADAIRS